MKKPDNWQTQQKVLVILAHPDDPEFFCGATLARWAKAGHEIRYCLLTCGEKGTKEGNITSADLCQQRKCEQQAAASVIGVKHIRYLDQPDGYLIPNLELRHKVVRIIREEKPDVLVTCDPTNLFPSSSYGMNHPDHRYAGQVVLDSVFPAAGNPHFFPELLQEEGLQPHTPREVWISLTSQPNVTLDVTATWETKIRALKEHKSQIGNPDTFEQRMRNRRAEKSTSKKPRYEERFRVIHFA